MAVGGYEGKIQILSISSGETIRTLTLPPLDSGSRKKKKEPLHKPFSQTDLLAEESLSANAKVEHLIAFPKKINLSSPVEYTQILVEADLGGGRTMDVTRMVSWKGNEDLGKIDNRGVFTPNKNGEGTLIATLGDKSAKITVSVTGMGKEYKPDFISEVNPVISKLGCNAGTCHGAKDGKNGFKLSLRGYDLSLIHI